MLVPLVRVVRCAPKTHPCPDCRKRGRRQRFLKRTIRSLAYRQEAFLEAHYAEYKARCHCCKTFRSWPVDVPPKADYCPLVRQAVLDRLLLDRLNVERALDCMRRDFLLELSVGFVYDCLDWALRRLDLPGHRQRALAGFSGVLCVDELHLGRHTLLLATDPIADEAVGFALVSANDQDHMRRFLLMLKAWGFLPQLVISDGSNLYPAVLAEVWPQAKHQLCVFHVLKDITEKVLDAVRRLRRACERRGKAGRKRKRGRPKQGTSKRRASRGPTNKDKAAFVFKRRYLIVKRQEKLSQRERAELGVMFGYLPGLRTLWKFCQELYKVWDGEQTRQVARWRWTRLMNNGEYAQVPELQEALAGLDGEKWDKTQAFVGQPLGQREKTNNHVERMNRKLRFDEKVRYKWRSRKSIVRWLLLRICVHAPRPKACAQAPPAAQQASPSNTPAAVA